MAGVIEQTGSVDPTNSQPTITQGTQPGSLDVYRVVYSKPFNFNCFCNYSAPTHKAIRAHLINTHHFKDVSYVCGKCEFVSSTLSSVSCHYPKCKSSIQPSLAFKCCDCIKSFGSKSGLSLHRRAAHKLAYFSEVESGVNRNKARWSLEENKILVQLEIKYAEERFVNEAIFKSGCLPNRTQESIKSHRKDAGYRSMLSAAVLEQSNHSGEESLTESEETRLSSGFDMEDSNYEQEESDMSERIGRDRESSLDLASIQDDMFRQQLFRSAFEVLDPDLTSYVRQHIDGHISAESCVQMQYDMFKALNPNSYSLSRRRSSVSERGASARSEPEPGLPRGRSGVPTSSEPGRTQCRRRRQKQRERAHHAYQRNKDFDKDPRSYLDRLINNIPDNYPRPDLSTVHDHFVNIFQSSSSEDSCKYNVQKKSIQNSDTLLSWMSKEEVIAAIKATKSTTAAGPDLLNFRKLKSIKPDHLIVLFNTWLVCRRVPNIKECWTKLLLKSPTDTANIKNWRPITIGNLLLRIYTKILAKRLNFQVPWNQRQKAFRPGCSVETNIILLDTILSEKWKCKEEVHIVLLDLAKAFDSISHHSVVRALKRFDVPEQLIDIIQDLYTGASTRIGFDKQALGEEIYLNRGVKQGCPLSPILFNLVMDELFDILDVTGIGAKIGDTEPIPSLGFADDIVLVSQSIAGMNLLLREASTFFSSRSVKLNPHKCTSVSCMYDGHRKIQYTATVSKFSVQGYEIKMESPENLVRYLGANFTYKGLESGISWVRPLFEKIASCRIKPRRKLRLIRDFVIPKIKYRLSLSRCGKTDLRRVDRLVRKVVKESLNLPMCTSNDFLYLPVRLGGLGIENLEERIIMNRIAITERLNMCTDPSTTIVTDNTTWKRSVVFLKVMMDAINVRSREERNKYIDKRMEARLDRLKHSAQGIGLEVFSNMRYNPNRNNLLRGSCEPNALKDQSFIDLIKLRTSLIPTRSVMSRIHPNMNTKCRFCNEHRETIAHLSQKCTNSLVRGLRSIRHDRVRSVFANKLKKKKYDVIEEYQFKTASGIYRPDIVCVKDNVVSVVDIAIPYDDSICRLDNSVRGKVEYYRSRKEELGRDFPGSVIKFYGLAVGARGGWAPANRDVVRELNICKYTQALLQRVALEGTLKLFRSARLGGEKLYSQTDRNITAKVS